MAHLHTGQHATWTHPNGQKQGRLDYICLPQKWKDHTQRTWVDDTMTLPLQRRDHYPVLADAHITAERCNKRRHKKPTPDSDLVRQKAYLHITEGWNQTDDTAEWTMPVFQQADALQVTTMKQWSQHACIRPAPKRKQHLTDATWQFVQYKKELWQRQKQQDKLARQASVRTCFNAWAHRPSSSHQLEEPCLHRDRIFLDLHLRWARNEVTRRVRQDDSD